MTQNKTTSYNKRRLSNTTKNPILPMKNTKATQDQPQIDTKQNNNIFEEKPTKVNE